MPHKPYTNGKMARDVGVVCLLIASILLTLAYRQQIADVKKTIYKRCMDRVVYDAASNEMRKEMSLRFRNFAEQEQMNPFIDETLRRKRVESWTALADQADKAIAAQVRGNCNAYR